MNKEKVRYVLTMLLILVTSIIISFCFARSCQQTIDKAGGLREIVVQEGKAAKSIYKDIKDDNYTRTTNPQEQR